MASPHCQPFRLQGTPVAYEQAPPLLGEHTAEVLTKLLGKAPDEVERLRNKGIV